MFTDTFVVFKWANVLKLSNQTQTKRWCCLWVYNYW